MLIIKVTTIYSFVFILFLLVSSTPLTFRRCPRYFFYLLFPYFLFPSFCSSLHPDSLSVSLFLFVFLKKLFLQFSRNQIRCAALYPPAILYLYKGHTRMKWQTKENSKATLWLMNYFPTCNPFLHRRNITSLLLLCHHFHGKCADKLRSLVPPVLTCHAMHLQRTTLMTFVFHW